MFPKKYRVRQSYLTNYYISEYRPLFWPFWIRIDIHNSVSCATITCERRGKPEIKQLGWM